MTGSPSQVHYASALGKMLRDRELRVFLWRLLVEDCKLEEEYFPMNAAAYCLLAKQEIGKRLLHDAKAVDLKRVHQAEQEYQELLRETDAWNRAQARENDILTEGENHGEQ